MPSPLIKKPPVTQVLIEMALAAGQGIGPTVKFNREAGAFFNRHYKTTVKLAISRPKADWTEDRKNVLRVGVIMGKKARLLALRKKDKTIDKEIAKEAARFASSSRLCIGGGGNHCP